MIPDGLDEAQRVDSRIARYVYFEQFNGPYLEWQLDQFRPYLGQRILEIGCGIGSLIARLGPRELIHGVDVEEDLLCHTAERFKDRPECRFDLADLGSAAHSPDRLSHTPFDSILCVNVLEHIQDDLLALRRMEQLVVRGGHLALLVPAHPALFGPYDELDGHFRRYSRSHLLSLIRQTEWQVVRCYSFNCVGAIGWWLKYRWLRRRVHGAAEFRGMKAIVPIMRVMERWFPPPFGLSLVAILRRG
jgi:SAM-dependent methyltransferase